MLEIFFNDCRLGASQLVATTEIDDPWPEKWKESPQQNDINFKHTKESTRSLYTYDEMSMGLLSAVIATGRFGHVTIVGRSQGHKKKS